MKNNGILLIIVALIIGGAGGFFAGMQYQQGQRSNSFQQFAGGQGSRNGNQVLGRARMMGGRQTVGKIISHDNKSITVELQDGSSKIVMFSDSTNINKASKGQVSDLTDGTQVAVFGIENTDGTVIAQNIQINPIFRGPTGGTPGQ